jgi:hypothetical protein
LILGMDRFLSPPEAIVAHSRTNQVAKTIDLARPELKGPPRDSSSARLPLGSGESLIDSLADSEHKMAEFGAAVTYLVAELVWAARRRRATFRGRTLRCRGGCVRWSASAASCGWTGKNKYPVRLQRDRGFRSYYPEFYGQDAKGDWEEMSSPPETLGPLNGGPAVGARRTWPGLRAMWEGRRRTRGNGAPCCCGVRGEAGGGSTTRGPSTAAKFSGLGSRSSIHLVAIGQVARRASLG